MLCIFWKILESCFEPGQCDTNTNDCQICMTYALHIYWQKSFSIAKNVSIITLWRLDKHMRAISGTYHTSKSSYFIKVFVLLQKFTFGSLEILWTMFFWLQLYGIFLTLLWLHCNGSPSVTWKWPAVRKCNAVNNWIASGNCSVFLQVSSVFLQVTTEYIQWKQDSFILEPEPWTCNSSLNYSNVLDRSVSFLVWISDLFARDSSNSIVPTAFIIGIILIQPFDSLLWNTISFRSSIAVVASEFTDFTNINSTLNINHINALLELKHYCLV